jgi:general secretion pathway protein G
MIELVFVIAVIGILSAIAIPKFAVTRNDAIVTKAKTTVGALRSAIATERQKRILKGDFSNISGSDAESLLEYGLGNRWSRSGDTFTFTAPDGSTCVFKVQNNKLEKQTCNVSGMSDL